MNKLDKLFLRIARTSRWKMQQTALDGRSDECRVARLALRIDASTEDAKKKWITVKGTHVPVGEGGKITGGPSKLKKESESRHGGKGGKAPSTPSATGENKLARGFTPSRAKEHEKHRKAQYPELNPKQYEQRGIDLCEQKVGGDIDGFMDNAGNIVRYRKSTNELAIGHPQNGLMTLFKPKKDNESGYAYFKKIKSSAEKSAQKGKSR